GRGERRDQHPWSPSSGHVRPPLDACPDATPAGPAESRAALAARQADSSASSAAFASVPPRYWPMLPSLRTTRWHGTTTGTGLCEQALPTARTAFGLPAARATAA